ncbi:hypothetical protein Bca4012_087691 [Brassica carinata]
MSFERFWICMFFRSGFDMQVFQIWKTSGTTYILEVFQTTSISVVWTSWKSSGLPGSHMDFLEVIWTSWKSYGLPGSHMDFMEVF